MAATTENLTRLEELQYKMYADARFAMLIALQAIDGGGKDSTIRRVFGAFNPQGLHGDGVQGARAPMNCATTSCGASTGTHRPGARSRCSTARTTRMC